MSEWYYKVSSDLGNIPDCVEHFESELQEAKKELSLKNGKSIEQHGSELPGIVEHRYLQLQEIEGILEYLNIRLRKLRSSVFKKYLENYPRSLSSRDCEKYTDGDEDVIALTYLVNEVALLRNKYLGLYKGLEQKGWMLSHIVKLRAAGLEDINI
jgi:hypothetical protein